MDVAALRNAAALDWSAIDPSIFGTLFERGLDPKKRSQLGAHYTDPATIMRLVEPVVQRPLRAEWEQVKGVIVTHVGKSKRRSDAEYRRANDAFVAYLEKLRGFRVLDPACGSGNFLYLALKALKDMEHQANIEAEALGLQRQVDAYTSPANVLGIELNEYAAELARVTVWIGELQWRLQHGYPFKVNPVLDPLDQIECRDALINADGSEAVWPRVSVVIGNPPFVGDRKMIRDLGEDYTTSLRAAYKSRVPGGADLVCYWFEKAREMIESGGVGSAGLVSTNSIRGGLNRQVLDQVQRSTRIYEAWSDEFWVNEGAAVRVSLVAFGRVDDGARLNGQAVQSIHADLTGATTGQQSVDLTAAARLAENSNVSFIGTQKNGPFEINGRMAREWLGFPNPNGLSNATVVRPWTNGRDLTTRPSNTWIVDFDKLAEQEAGLFEAPFAHVSANVKPTRLNLRRDWHRTRWWSHGDPRPAMKRATRDIARHLLTPRVSKHRVFVWVDRSVLADSAVVAIARADDVIMGLLHSCFHELWSLRMGSSLEDRPRYTPTSCFETFPFPAGLTPADTAHQRTELATHAPSPRPSPTGAGEGATSALIPTGLPPSVRPHAVAIALAAKHLDVLRNRWLNPPEWTRLEPEVVPLGMDRSPYPDRILARDGFEQQLAQRTLTKLYNERPAWLRQAHEALDAAVAPAYGWMDYTSQTTDEEILRRLLALNRERSALSAA